MQYISGNPPTKRMQQINCEFGSAQGPPDGQESSINLEDKCSLVWQRLGPGCQDNLVSTVGATTIYTINRSE